MYFFRVVEMYCKSWLETVDTFVCGLYGLSCWESIDTSILTYAFAYLSMKLKKRTKIIKKKSGK